MLATYGDFGDVRYNGCRYKAFTRWWTHKVTSEESRGEFLFAEPLLTDGKLAVIENVGDAERYLLGGDFLVVAIPLNQQRRQIDATLDRHLKKRLKTKKGRDARNPKHSKALYRLSKPYVVGALKKTFDLYTAKIENEVGGGKKLSNVDLAKLCALIHKTRKNVDYVSDETAQRRVVSIEVSRYLANAKRLILNAAHGVF